MSRLRPLLLLCSVATTLCLAACSDEPAPVRDRPSIGEEKVERMIAAMRELRDAAKAMPASDAPTGTVPHFGGMGLTALVGRARAEPIVTAHGFTSVEDFEGTVGYVQQALNRVWLGKDGGMKGMGKLELLKSELRDLKDQRDRIRRGGTPDETIGSSTLELDRRIAELEDQIEGREDVVAAWEDHLAEIPEQTLQAVRNHQDELKALLGGA